MKELVLWISPNCWIFCPAALEKAFGGESQARNKYTYFAEVAETEGYHQIAEIFRVTAENERMHAKLWAAELGKIRGTADNLKSAAEGEHWEWAEMYEDFANTAEEEGFDKLLQAHHLPTAFLCAGDSFAIDAIRYAKQKGLRIPEDISIMSLDDLLVSQYLDPPLSTMTFQKDLLGQKAMHLLYQIMENQPHEPVNLIKTVPVERCSVKKI